MNSLTLLCSPFPTLINDRTCEHDTRSDSLVFSMAWCCPIPDRNLTHEDSAELASFGQLKMIQATLPGECRSVTPKDTIEASFTLAQHSVCNARVAPLHSTHSLRLFLPVFIRICAITTGGGSNMSSFGRHGDPPSYSRVSTICQLCAHI